MSTVTYTFTIPFGGGPAEVCAAEIKRRITHALLNSLSGIHPDIRCEVTEALTNAAGTGPLADSGLTGPLGPPWESRRSVR